MKRRTFTTAGLMALLGKTLRGDEDDEGAAAAAARANLVSPTWGGKQFWQDELFFHEWHIQRNALTGHCRLLDGRQRRHGWGTFDQCRAQLDSIRRRDKLPPMSGAGVVVLHGLMRSRATMDKLCRSLREKGKLSVFNVAYPTTRGSVERHAEALGRVLTSLEGIDELHVVAHSLGNLVVRGYLAAHSDPALGKQPDGRLKRMVMLGPPNNGAKLAEMLGRNLLFEMVVGASGTQIARDWQQLAGRLATPAFEFGILAGGRGNAKGFNPLLGEDNDLVVEVSSTRLAGAADFSVLPVLHTFMMDDPTVQEYTLRFLQSGYFISPERRQPIPAEGAS
jgi:pimeloyl-ACP methyl ester carboxylesterase